jgi:hypothetical protein
MQRLPVELIAQICTQLCMHCSSPDALPHADTTDARLAKAALARFARTARCIHAIAQPYVFHFYATGNIPRLVVSQERGCATHLATPYPNEFENGHDNDHLPLFLRTVIQRPDLAAHIKALQLISSPKVDDLARADMDAIGATAGEATDLGGTSSAFRMLRKASVELGVVDLNMFHPDCRWRPGRYSVLSVEDGTCIHHTLEQLALLFCPNVNTLVFCSPFDTKFMITTDQPFPYTEMRKLEHFWGVIKSSHRDFPSLAKVALLSHTRHFLSREDILCSMPNIETFHGAHLRFPGPSYNIRFDPWVNPMSHVRRLVVSELNMDDLEVLVLACPRLRDLEYRHHGHFSRAHQVDGPGILQALSSATRTLRQLVLVSMGDCDPRGALVGGTEALAIPSLSAFTKLEELALNQNHLAQGGVADDDDEEQQYATSLAEFLPRSIKRVRILYFWWMSDEFFADLEDLARDAPSRVPDLRSVRISHLDHETYDDPDYDPTDWFPVEEGQHERARELLAVANVSLTWDRLKYKMPRAEGKPAPGKNYLSTPYCFWEAPDVGHGL